MSLLRITDRHRLQMPDIPVIIADRTVGGELAAAGGVHDAHAGPALSILIRSRHALLGIDEAAEIRGNHPGILRGADRVNDRVEETVFILTLLLTIPT